MSICRRGRSRSPSLVSVSRRVVRWKSAEPISSSSRLTRFVTTEAARPVSRAAAEKLPARAVTRNALISSNCGMITRNSVAALAAWQATQTSPKPLTAENRRVPAQAASGAPAFLPRACALSGDDAVRSGAMILYPAIDLKDGQCVRLLRGAMDRATVFGDDPAAQARAFAAAGCRWLHLVDLNGAFAGRPVNAAAVEAILAAVEVPVQLGGGIRDRATIEAWLDKGVARVILGTAAMRDPALVREAARTHPGKVAVGIDARDGLVAVEGWAEKTGTLAVDLARRFEDAGVAAIIYTDIDRDGALEGPNVAATVALADAVLVPVIASGGIASMDDLRALKESGAALDGAISGRALYEGRLDLAEAIAYLAA